jgi:hypothetical protein
MKNIFKVLRKTYYYYRGMVQVQKEKYFDLNFIYSMDLSLHFYPNDPGIIIRSNGRYVQYHSRNVNELKEKIGLMITTLVEFYNFIIIFQHDNNKDFQYRTFLNNSSQRYYGSIQAIYSVKDNCFEIAFSDCWRNFYLTTYARPSWGGEIYYLIEFQRKIKFLIDSLKRVETELYSGKF